MSALAPDLTASSPHPEYVTVNQALDLWQVDPRTLRRKRRLYGIPSYARGVDDRQKWLRVADLTRALGPVRKAPVGR